MTRLRPATLMIPLLALSCVGLTGCVGCAADRHAEAQAPDASVPPPPPPEPEPEPLPETVVVPAPYAYGGAAGCFVAAQRRLQVLDEQAFLLCQGAASPGPVDCYLHARRLMLADAQRLTLCRCAMGTEPVECVDMLQRETWITDAQMVELCAPTIVDRLLPNCRPAGGW